MILIIQVCSNGGDPHLSPGDAVRDTVVTVGGGAAATSSSGSAPTQERSGARTYATGAETERARQVFFLPVG